MSTYTQIIYQIVFHTKFSKPTLNRIQLDNLFAYISGILKKCNCHCYAIGGIEDHIHIITNLHPVQSLSHLVKTIKLATSDYIKRTNSHPQFDGWQTGYGAFTYTIKEKEKLIRYVLNQEKHHKNVTAIEELKSYLIDNLVEFDSKYLP